MFIDILLILIALIWIVFAVVQDVRSKEVANWLNFSLIILILGVRFFYSLFNSDWNFLFQGLIGLAIFAVIGNLFYYGRVFAGGDAKLLIALGTVLPVADSFLVNLRIFAVFFLLFLLVGALYGVFYSFVLITVHFGRFKKGFKKMFNNYKRSMIYLLVVALIALLLTNVSFYFLPFALFIFILPYFILFAKVIEKEIMKKEVKVKDLREGDWLYNDLKIKGKAISAKWEGLSLGDIKFIQKHYRKKVVVKDGIPFTPVFLISFTVLICLWYSSWKFIFYLFL